MPSIRTPPYAELGITGRLRAEGHYGDSQKLCLSSSANSLDLMFLSLVNAKLWRA
jgi:hypothetical protein